MTYPDANVVTLIGSIRNISRLESVLHSTVRKLYIMRRHISMYR